MILPAGLEDPYAIKADDIMKFKTQVYGSDGYLTDLFYRVETRGLVTKMPGFFFTGL